MRKNVVRRSLLAMAIAACFSSQVSAQDSSWNVDASGNWSDTANWAGGIPANGSGFTATFTNDLTDDRTVTLDSARTITNLTFGDANPATAGSWILSNGGIAANTLTLAGTTPTINVGALGSGKSVTVGAVIAGTVGLTKTGSGTLILSNNTNTFTGGLNVNAGTVQVGTGANNSGNLVPGNVFTSNSITVGSGAVLEFRKGSTSTSVEIANDFNSGAGTLRLTGANDGLANGLSNSIGVYNLSGDNSALPSSFTIAANSARVTITNAEQIGLAKLVTENNGQFDILSGTYSNAITIQGGGWSDTTGNLGALRLTSTTLTGTITLANDARFTTQSYSYTSTLRGVIAQSGSARTLEIGVGATDGSNITLAGANTYTGGTIINGPLGTNDLLSFNTTSLTLSYASQNNSKLSDSGVLLFKGPSKLILAGGTHIELVGSTTLDAGASSSITRSSGDATLNLGALTRNAAATLNVGTAAIVKTSSGTAGEAFGAWFTVGTDLATKDAGNNIVAATFFDVPTGTGTIVEGPATNVRVTSTAIGTVALGGSPGDTITINTLTRQVTGTATVDITGKTLRIRNGILANGSASGLFLGSAKDVGVLTAGTTNDTPGTLEMNITATASAYVRSTISDNGTGAVSLTKMGTGLLNLTGTNTFTGGTTLSGGRISISNSSAFGSGPITVASASLLDSSTFTTPGYTIGNNFVLNSAATLTLDSGSASFDLNGVISGAGNFTADGSSSGSNVLTLTNTNTYTGITTVEAGKLLLGNGGHLAATPIFVADTGIFGVKQNANNTTNTIAGTLTLQAGGAFTMADGYTSTLNAGSNAVFTGNGIRAILTFDLGGTTTASDRLNIAGTVSGTGPYIVNINGIGTTALTPGAYPIITATAGLNATNFTLGKAKTLVNGTAYGISLNNTATASVINVTGVSGLDAAYWTGDQDGVWNTNNSGNSNWSTAAAGTTEAGASPNGVTDVYFAATGATNLTTTLGADTTIHSLNYTATSGATTIGPGNTLTIGSANSVVSGITIASGAAAQTINAPLNLGNAQTWTNSSANPLTVGGAVDNGGFGMTVTGTGSTTISGALTGSGALTKSGTGTLTVSGANSYSGDTTLAAGTLKVASSTGLGTGQALALNGGTLHLASDTPVLSKNVTLGANVAIVLDRATSGTGITTTFGGFNFGTASRTITVSNGSNVTGGTSTLEFNGTLTMNSFTATFDLGTGTAVHLNGTESVGNKFLTINKNGLGTLIFSGNVSTWEKTDVSLNAGTVELRSLTGNDRFFNYPIQAAAGTTVRLVEDANSRYITDLKVNGSMQVVADRLTAAATNTTHTLGNLTIGAQTLTIARGSNITGAGIAGLTFNDSEYVGGTGSTTLTGNATFNTEANTLLTMKGLTSGAYSLTKTGLGTMTLNWKNTYSGGTIVNNGTLNLGFGTKTSNILLSTAPLTLSGGKLSLTGTGTQTINSVTTALATSSNITLATNETLTLGTLTAGAGSLLNINTAAGGANASTSTIGTGIVVLAGQTAGKSINIGYTVTDAGGTGLATVNASNQVIRMNAAISTLLPASGAAVANDYLIDNNAGGVAAAGSSSLTVTATQSARTISVDTTAASGVLTVNSGAILRNNGWLFSGTGSNTYKITGPGTLTAAASNNPITFYNLNTGNVTIESVIGANGTNNVGFTGPGTTIIAATNTYTGVTGIASGIVQVGAGAILDGSATTGALPVSTTVTVAAGAKLIYNRPGQSNALAGPGPVEFYGANNGTTSGTGSAVNLNNGSTAFSGTLLISGIRATVDNSDDLGSALVTVTPTGQIYATGATLANNFIISGTGWGETGHVHGALRSDGSRFDGTVTLAGDARIGGASATINGVIGESGGARKLMLGGGSSTFNSAFFLNAANTYTGGTELGSLANSTSVSVNVGNNLVFSTGTVNVLSTATMLSVSANRTLANPFVIASGKSFSVSAAQGTTNTLNGGISGGGDFFSSSGTVVVNGTNTYTGSTQVSAGTLQIGGSFNTGSSNLTIGSTFIGTLTLLNGGSFTTTGNTNVGNGVAGNVLNINAGGLLSTGGLNNAWAATYNIDGTLTAAGAWNITTNATSNINGAATGSISAASLSTGNASTIVNFNALGTTSIAGDLALAATTSGAVNITAGTVNVGGVTWGGAAQTLSLSGGRLNVGASGIASTGGSTRTINLGNATVGARGADWNSDQEMMLSGTGSGTTVNTLDSVDNTTARTITLAGSLSGAGRLSKTGAGALILTGANTYGGGTTIAAGTLQVGPGGTVGAGAINNDAMFDVARAGATTGAITGTGTTTVTAAGASLTANHIRQNDLIIGTGNTVTVATNGGDSGTSTVTNLSINATGKLDLMNNDMIVDNGNLATLTALLSSGLDINGTYGGGQGITSSAFASNPNFNTVLGIAANAELGYTSFSGQSVDANDVLIKYTYYGDADLNGLVDTATDFDLYITGLTSGGSLGGWLYGDFDYNGNVDSATDFDLYITGLTSQGGPLLTAGSGGSLVQAVPEPSTWVMGCLGMMGLAASLLCKRRSASESGNC